MVKFLKFLSWVLALVAINQVFVLSPAQLSQNYYFGIFSIILVILLSLNLKGLHVNNLVIWLIFAALLSFLMNVIPVLFRAPQRLLIFVLVISLIGPLLNSPLLRFVKINAFYATNRILLVLVIVSFIFYFLRLPIPSGRGGFSGLFNHSMMLGPLAAISMLLAIFLRFKAGLERKRLAIKWLLNLAIFFSFFCILLASSRAALLGTIAGLLFFFYKYYQKHISMFLTIILGLTFILLVTFPLYSDYTEGLNKKIDASKAEGDMASSRKIHWAARLTEFKSSPVFGIGFATVAADNNSVGLNKETGGVEPGTSWITVFSMIGIFGFLPVFLLFLKNMIFLFKDHKNRLLSAIMGALLVFFITHMFAEGYIFAAGSFLFFYLWLLLGVLEIYRRQKSIKII